MIEVKGKEFIYTHHFEPHGPLVPHATIGIGDGLLHGNLIIQVDNLKQKRPDNMFLMAACSKMLPENNWW